MSAVLQPPIIDIAAFGQDARHRSAIAGDVSRALTEVGFMYVVGHGVDAALTQRAFATSRRFFSQSPEFKQAHGYTDIAANFGFQGIEAERLDPGSLPDLKEAFTMRNASRYVHEPMRWPGDEFRDTALAFYSQGLAAAHRMLAILAESLGVAPEFFAVRHGGENVTLRFLHYPANQPLRSDAQLGAGAHTDYGSITLLWQDDVGGLELFSGGEWQPAPPVPDAILINTGDLMQRWTNARYRSTVHRVRPVTGARDRYSIALFVDPDSAVEVECIAGCAGANDPARFPRITAGEHIRQKIAATHEGSK